MSDAPVLPAPWVELDAHHVVRRAGGEPERLFGAGVELVGRRFVELLTVAGRVFFQTHVVPALALHGRADELYLPVARAGAEPVTTVANAVRRGVDGDVVDTLVLLPLRRRQLHEQELVDAWRRAATLARGEAAARAEADEGRTRLAAAERMATLGQLAASVAHELNNPLTFVAANLELLADRTLPGDSAALVADVRDGVTRLRDIIASLRSLSRLDERRGPVDVRAAIDAALKIARAELRTRAQVAVDVPRPAPWALAVEGGLVQVLLNLLVNAAQALPADRHAHNQVRIAAAIDGEHVVITVEDNGPGVPLARRGQIFEPFVTTKAAGVGTGLGLAVCRRIVAGLDGSIAVDDSALGGARFAVRLPLAVTPRTVTEPPPAPPVVAGRPRVLVIDDDASVARVLTRALRDCDVTWTASADDALARLTADGAASVDVVLCDLVMPGMTGMEFHAEAIARVPAVIAKLVFITGGLTTETAQRFLDEVRCPVLTKPFALARLRQVVTATAARSAGPAASA